MKIPTQLKSRKFWLATAAFLAALSGFIVSLVNGDLSKASEFLGGMLAAAGLYTVAEGAADVVGRYQKGKEQVAETINRAVNIEIDDDAPDYDNIVTGEDI